MRKLLLTGLVFGLILSVCSTEALCAIKRDIKKSQKESSIETDKAYKSVTNSQEIKHAITAYKKGDFLACISILKEYTEKNEENAVAWYYLGSAYMNIAMTTEANAAFDKVIELNSITSTPKLTSYAIQAQMCMQNPEKCKYENFSVSEVKKLKDNPAKFISDYYATKRQKSIKSDDVIQIENLIKGSYANNIHPAAQDFILNERAKIKASQINSGKS